eukprot:GDKI01040593.1.p1 GENE.GDKI01040593.1~~GDKI01040593.1.p1  ORF type:complete len:214 (-),score=24.51 GDKI01040593.1:28-669(-)
MVELDQIIGRLPPVTKLYLVLSVGLMAGCSLDLVSPFTLYLNWELVIKELQLWRLITCFFFFGTFGIQFFWNCYILIFYCSSLEEVAFRNKSADFLWMLIVTMSLLLCLSYFFGSSYFFSGAMIDVMTYIWGRRNPHARMNVFFFTVRAPYLPWALAGMSLLLGGQIKDHLLGIAVGHTYFFFEDVYPLMPTSKGTRIFKTPKLLKMIFRESV